jgi:DNA-binding beta-propeller fold protein YncE
MRKLARSPLLDVASRSVLGSIDVNPARTKSEGPGAPNYAQDTDVSPDGRTLYVSRGYLGDVAAFDIASGPPAVAAIVRHWACRPHDAHPDGGACSCRRSWTIGSTRVATATGEITGHLVTGVYPHDNKVSRDGRRLYNTSIGPIGTLPRKAGAPPLTETPGYPFQLTYRRRRHVADSVTGYGSTTPYAPGSLPRTRRASTRSWRMSMQWWPTTSPPGRWSSASTCR